MLKRFLLASCVMPMLLGSTQHAFALLGAGDIVTCTNCTTELHTIVNDAAIALQWITQLERMTAQIRMQQNIYGSLSGATNTNAMVTILNQPGNFNAMGSFGNVPQQLMGGGGGVGAAYQTYNGNVLPMGSPMPLLNAVQTVFNQRAGSLASVQGISASLLVTSNTILAGLLTLQRSIDGQLSAQKMIAINSRIAAYQGDINSQQYQLAQVQAFANAQQKVFEQREQQAVFCSASSWAAHNPSLSGAGLNLGAANCGGGGTGGIPIAVGGGIGGGVLLAAAPAGGAAGGTATTGGGFVDTGGFDTPPAAATGNVTAGTSPAGTTALPTSPAPPAAGGAAPDTSNVVAGDGSETGPQVTVGGTVVNNGPVSTTNGVAGNAVTDSVSPTETLFNTGNQATLAGDTSQVGTGNLNMPDPGLGNITTPDPASDPSGYLPDGSAPVLYPSDPQPQPVDTAPVDLTSSE